MEDEPKLTITQPKTITCDVHGMTTHFFSMSATDVFSYTACLQCAVAVFTENGLKHYEIDQPT